MLMDDSVIFFNICFFEWDVFQMVCILDSKKLLFGFCLSLNPLIVGDLLKSVGEFSQLEIEN